LFVKFRRKAEPTQASDGPDQSDAPAAAAPAAPTGTGPFDESEVAGDGVERVDLGSLLVRPTPGRELRLQVDEPTGKVQAVMLAGPDGALEFQAFAAPRNGDLWSTVRPQIAADIARRGGTTAEREGRFGTELLCQVPVQRPDGTQATQPSRIIGINGDRWMLRASLLGRPALEPEGAGEWEDALAQVVVRRGSTAMPVGEPLPVVLPEQARRVN
jgi:hypothetical protein